MHVATDACRCLLSIPLFKKYSAAFDSEGGKNLLLRYLKLILFSFVWEDKL